MGYSSLANFLQYSFIAQPDEGPFAYPRFRDSIMPPGYDAPFCDAICEELKWSASDRVESASNFGYFLQHDCKLPLDPGEEKPKKKGKGRIEKTVNPTEAVSGELVQRGRKVWARIAAVINKAAKQGSLSKDLIDYVRQHHRHSGSCAFQFHYWIPWDKWEEKVNAPPKDYVGPFASQLLTSLFGLNPEVLSKPSPELDPTPTPTFKGLCMAVHQRLWETEKRWCKRKQLKLAELVEEAFKIKAGKSNSASQARWFADRLSMTQTRLGKSQYEIDGTPTQQCGRQNL